MAFLIQDSAHAHLTLDGIFADCYGRWGGRFSLVVPTVHGRIPANYWPWLETYDPDIVYSYVPLNRDDVLEIHERLYPAHYHYHKVAREPRHDAYDFKPSYDLSPLSSLSVIFRLARYNPVGRRIAPTQIMDSWHTERPSRFLTDNFGTYHLSWGSSLYPRDAMAEASLLTIVSPGDQRGIPRDLNSVPSEMHALREFADVRATSLSILSSLLAQRLEIRSHRWSGSFNLVIGDTFYDRVLFWNARLLVPAWLDNDISALRVGFDQLQQPDFLEIIRDLLRHRNHVNAGAGGQPRLTVRSCSLSEAELDVARQSISDAGVWGSVSRESVISPDEVIPNDRELQASRSISQFDGGFPQADWTSFVWTPPVIRPTTLVPEHLSDAPLKQAFTAGFWCTDFLLEYDAPRPRFAEQNLWVLPRRWRLLSAFKISYMSEPRRGLAKVARRSLGGYVAIFVAAAHPVETITVPTPYKAMQYALSVDGARADENAEHDEALPTMKAAWIEPSNEARYLTGVLGMTEGIEGATRFLLHPFLRDFFAKLGGTPRLAVDAMAPTVNRLQKRAQREDAFDLRGENERAALAELIVKAAQSLKKSAGYVGYEDLRAAWKAYREAYWSAHKVEGDATVDWDSLEERSLDECLIEMRSRKILFQGHSWTCQNCHHRNWVDLNALSSELACAVCQQTEQAPVNIQWLFRPNEFLIESLRDHSVLSLVWVLSGLGTRSRRSLLFVEPTWFGFAPGADRPDAEADLLVVLDGRSILCEVKSSWRSLRASHISNLVALATRLRPDCAVLAIMDKGRGPLADLQEAERQLAAKNVKFELLTLDDFPPTDDPHLT